MAGSERAEGHELLTRALDQSKHLVLVGMMGSGKSTNGRRCAERLGRPFHDADALIEARAGRRIRDIFEHDGEPAFRALESDVLADLLALDEPSVIAGGGGIVLAAANRALARERGNVVWLRARPSTLVGRVNARTDRAGHRPLLDGDPAGQIARLADERRHLYEEVAHHVIDVDDLSPERVVTAIVELAGR